MTSPLARQIQGLGGHNERVLVILRAAELRNDEGSAAPGDVAELFRDLRLNPPSNERQHLAQLKKRNLVMQPRAGRWAVTPMGEEEIRALMANLPVDELNTLAHESGEPEFAGAAHHQIPWEFAPSQFQQAMSRFMDTNPFETNVFCMTRYSERDTDGALSGALEAVRNACENSGLRLHLASDRSIGDQLLENVGAYIWACQYGIAVLETRSKRGLNHNVMFEVGAMLALGRRCLILKDVSLKREAVPTDLVGQIYKNVDLDNAKSVATEVATWIQSDLGLG